MPVDVDDTLVMHKEPKAYDITVTLEDPHHAGKFITLGVNEPMVKILKDEKSRGACIIVWSRSGYAWAEAVVRALDLVSFVDFVFTKPLVYLDDSDVSSWLKDRVYLDPKTTYKKHDND